MIERVIVNPEGMIIRLELQPPFSYLHRLKERVQTSNGGAVRGKTKTSTMAGQCSDYVLLGEHGRIRTYNQLIKSQLRCHCATCPYFEYRSIYDLTRIIKIKNHHFVVNLIKLLPFMNFNNLLIHFKFHFTNYPTPESLLITIVAHSHPYISPLLP